MNKRMQQQLSWLERRSRMLTGTVLAVLALATSYGLLMFEGQLQRPAFHFYPWLMAVMFYAAGDLLAYIWFKVLTAKLAAMILSQPKQNPEDIAAEIDTALAAQEVEVVRPNADTD